MRSEARLKFLKKMIILGPKTAILGPQFGEFWCWGLILGGQGGPGPLGPPGSTPGNAQLGVDYQFLHREALAPR